MPGPATVTDHVFTVDFFGGRCCDYKVNEDGRTRQCGMLAADHLASIPAEQQVQGRKADAGKLRWDLMPWGQLRHVASVMTFGAKKYGTWNWTKVPAARERYFSAAQRHMVAWIGGEKKDPESGLPHLAHAICCLLFLMWFDD